jgi:hypothetical protein
VARLLARRSLLFHRELFEVPFRQILLKAPKPPWTNSRPANAPPKTGLS